MPKPQLDDVLFALADPHRRAVIDLLKDQPKRAGELAAALHLTAPALSRHLRVLRRSGLITEEAIEADARVRVCHLRKQPFEALRQWLDQVETFWTLELSSFRDHVATRTKR